MERKRRCIIFSCATVVLLLLVLVLLTVIFYLREKEGIHINIDDCPGPVFEDFTMQVGDIDLDDIARPISITNNEDCLYTLIDYNFPEEEYDNKKPNITVKI